MKHGRFEVGDHVVTREGVRMGIVRGFCPVESWPRVEWQYGPDTHIMPDRIMLDPALGRTAPTRQTQTA